jgi:hypothetical protein
VICVAVAAAFCEAVGTAAWFVMIVVALLSALAALEAAAVDCVAAVAALAAAPATAVAVAAVCRSLPGVPVVSWFPASTRSRIASRTAEAIAANVRAPKLGFTAAILSVMAVSTFSESV